MNKKNEKKIVKIAEEEIKKFVKEWKKNPYLWDSEADVHGELYVRMKNALKSFGKIPGRYKTYMSKKAQFNRIYCKPLTYIERGERYYPDIVIYNSSTFNDDDKKINEPMLWVCEIKYKTQWGGDQSGENREYDEEKLRQLLRHRTNPKMHRTKYAYFLGLERTKKKAVSHYGRVKMKKRGKQ